MLGMPTFDLTDERGKQEFRKWITFAIKNEINSYARQVLNINNEGASGSGNPTGPAGGVLAGNYPNPIFAADMATQAELDTHTTATTSVHGITDTANLVYQDTPYLDFNIVSPGASGTGQIAWNDTAGTLEFGLKGGSVTLQIGEEQVSLVKHADSSGLAKGAAVYVAGSDGSNKTVRYAQANAESTSSKTFGIMAETATGGNKAFCCTHGIVENLDTSTLTEGAAVWLSPSVAGGLTTTKPSAPNHLVLLGWCVRSNSSNGIIFVHVVNGFELDELHDVSIVSKTNKDLLAYDSASGLWKNTAPALAIPASTITSSMIVDGTIVNADVSNSAAIASSKLDLSAYTGHIVCTSSTRPASPIDGMMIYETDTDVAYIYNAGTTTWVKVGGGLQVSDSAPSNPLNGDLWFKSSNGKTYVYYSDGSSNQWVEIGENAQVTIPGHASTHVRGGSDLVDGDRLSIDYSPTYYTRNSAAAGAGDITDLTAHLSGIDNTLASVSVPTSNRNAIINGSMTVAQRSTSSVALTTSFAYGSVDRWIAIQAGTAAGTVQQVTSSLPTQFYRGVRIGRNSSATATGNIAIATALETVDSLRFQGQSVTLSFYAKAGANYSSASNILTAFIYTGTGTDQAAGLLSGSWTGSANPLSQNVTLTTSWQRFSLTTTIASSATQIGIMFRYTPVGTAGADDNIYITGVQLETGSVATPFEFESFETTLRKCMRYYQTGTLQYVPIGPISYYNSSHWSIPYTVTMRTTPNASYNGLAWVAGASGATAKSGSGTIGDNKNLKTEMSGGTFTAWYSGSWTADAEL